MGNSAPCNSCDDALVSNLRKSRPPKPRLIPIYNHRARTSTVGEVEMDEVSAYGAGHRAPKPTLVPLSYSEHAFHFDTKSKRLVMGLHDVDSLTGFMDFNDFHDIASNDVVQESPTPRRQSLSYDRRFSVTPSVQVLDDWEAEDIYDHPHQFEDDSGSDDESTGSVGGGDAVLPDAEVLCRPFFGRQISRDEESEMKQRLKLLTKRHSESLCLDMAPDHNSDTESVGSTESMVSTLSGVSSTESELVRGHLLREHSADKWDEHSIEAQTVEMQQQISRLCGQYLAV